MIRIQIYGMMQSKSAQAIKLAYKKGYRIQDDGRVVSPHLRFLKLRVCPKHKRTQYHVFNIKLDCSYPIQVYRLAAFQLFGEASLQQDIEVRHLDGNSLNSRPDNLALGSASDNSFDRLPADRMRQAKHAASFLIKYPTDVVRRMHDRRAQGASLRTIAQEFGCSKSSASLLCRKRIL